MTRPEKTQSLSSRPAFSLLLSNPLQDPPRQSAWCRVLISICLRGSSLSLLPGQKVLFLLLALSVSLAECVWLQGHIAVYFTIFHSVVLEPEIPEGAKWQCFSKISSYLLSPHPESVPLMAQRALEYQPTFPCRYGSVFSASPHLRNSALHWCLSLRRALVLRQEALCKNVRFRGWGGILGLCQWKKGRDILGNRPQFFGFFYEESYFPSSLPERTDMCWLIGDSGLV